MVDASTAVITMTTRSPCSLRSHGDVLNIYLESSVSFKDYKKTGYVLDPDETGYLMIEAHTNGCSADAALNNRRNLKLRLVIRSERSGETIYSEKFKFANKDPLGDDQIDKIRKENKDRFEKRLDRPYATERHVPADDMVLEALSPDVSFSEKADFRYVEIDKHTWYHIAIDVKGGSKDDIIDVTCYSGAEVSVTKIVGLAIKKNTSTRLYFCTLSWTDQWWWYKNVRLLARSKSSGEIIVDRKYGPAHGCPEKSESNIAAQRSLGVPVVEDIEKMFTYRLLGGMLV